jgi:predicted dehydrogenase
LAPPDRQPPDLQLPGPPSRKVGYAVVGLGELALGEVMPAFALCNKSRCAALVSGHPEKAQRVARAYGIEARNLYTYDNYDRLADNQDVEAIYIILPNSMHAEYTTRGLRAGKHVLCEKPMATSVDECNQMIAAARESQKKLMIAYRLHYEPFNRRVMQLCREKKYGDIKTISASNCQDTKAPNIRLSRRLGGGPVGDIGIYCINAARYITNEEPTEVTAFAHQPQNVPRFREVPESVAFTLKFPSGVVANCDCSFAAAESRRYRVHCSQGWIDLDPAFSYRGLQLHVMEEKQRSQVQIMEVNHFASEMDHFSECIMNDRQPRTPGEEGLADMRIIAAIEEAARTGRAVRIRNA